MAEARVLVSVDFQFADIINHAQSLKGRSFFTHTLINQANEQIALHNVNAEGIFRLFTAGDNGSLFHFAVFIGCQLHLLADIGGRNAFGRYHGDIGTVFLMKIN